MEFILETSHASDVIWQKHVQLGPVYTDLDKLFARMNFVPGPPVYNGAVQIGVYTDPCKV